jgi:hypothetical protein
MNGYRCLKAAGGAFHSERTSLWVRTNTPLDYLKTATTPRMRERDFRRRQVNRVAMTVAPLCDVIVKTASL